MANAAANPYVGPRTFTYVERERFFGREREARDLLSLVISERLVLFYAQSGAGKSSLLNTRLIPQLKEAGYAVLPMVRVGGELPEGVSDVDNIFVFNCLLHLHQRSGGPRRFAHMTLKDFLSRLTSPDGETYYYDDNAEPAEDMGAYEEPLHVLLIDQFEEIVTAHLERWQEREAFFRQLEEAMAADPRLWVVLTLREDYVAALDPYAGLLSNRLRARFYMQRMGYEAALEAVRRPAQQSGRPFAPGVAETLVDNLRQIRVRDTPATGPGQFVEPVQLQVACYQLWENLQNRDAGAITTQDLLEAGDVDTALASFYEEALASVLHDGRVRGVTELAVRQWFDQYLITEAGTRGMVYRGETHTAEMPNLVVQLLEDRYVLRSEIRSGGIWYELIHDRFVEPIARANRAWWDKQSPLMRDAQAWQEAHHDQGKLYLGAKLQEVLASATQGEPEPIVVAFLAASAAEQHELDAKEAARQRELEQAQALAEEQQRRAEEQARVAGRLRRLLVALVVVSLLVVGVGIYAWVTRAQAVAEQRRAEHQARLSFSRELAAAAIKNLDIDTERGVLLALHAASVTYSVNKSVTLEAEDALHRAVQASRVRLTLAGHTSEVVGVAFSPDGTHLATASRDKTAKVWDVSSGREVLTLSGHTNTVQGVAFSPDGTHLATASSDNTAKVWDVSSGREVLTLSGHTNAVSGVAFSPDGTHLATASSDNTAKVWDVSSGREVLTLSGHTNTVRGVAFSPDGTHLATASWDKTAKVWDVSSGREVLTLSGHTSEVVGVAFSPDGTRLATTSYDRTVRVYALNIENLMALVRRRITRSLTFQECQKYLHEEQGCPPAVVALNQVVEGNNLARAGDVDSAIVSFRRALELDPALRLAPEVEARRFAAEALVGKGERLAKAGDVDGAVASWRRALELDPTLHLAPEEEARRFAAEALVEKGSLLVRQSKVKDAIAAYAGAERLDPTLKIPARSWNTLCWRGSLWRLAGEVMFACERAVELQPEDWGIRDSRGVARAMTGDIKGAIEDFQEYMKKAKDTVKKSQRQRWVDALRAGEDPFTDEEIKTLFYQ